MFERSRKTLEREKKLKIDSKIQGRTEGREEIINELQEAQSKGIPLEKILEKYQNQNGNKTNENPTAKEL